MKRPLRVIHVIGKVEMGGVQAVVMNYYKNINKSKIKFDFIIDGYKDTPIDNIINEMGGNVYKVEPYSSNIIRNIIQCYKIFKTGNYDIVHCHLNTLSVFPLFAAWLASVKIRISHSHSTASKGETKRNLIKYILRPFSKLFATNFCACSEYAGKWLFGNRSYVCKKVKLIKNAIEIDSYSYDFNLRTQIRNELNLNDKLVVGHVGRFVYQKNHQFLIDIFDKLHQKIPNSVLMLVGDGELRKDIEAKVKDLGLDDCVIFLGNRFDVPKLMQVMDIFILPSFYEGLPVVGVEAQASGLKCFFSTSITKESKITELVKFIGLSKSDVYWADKIIKNLNYNRIKLDNQIKNSGFEIKTAASDLSKWYFHLYKSL